MKIKNITIFGGANVSPHSYLYQEIGKVSQLLASSGYTVINGGGSGAMLAATNGAESVNGQTVSVTFNPIGATGFEGIHTQNKTDFNIKTANYFDRLHGLIENGDIYIIFNGGTGTLSEFTTVWCLARLYYGNHKPFILYGSFWHEIIDVICQNMYIRDNELKVFQIVETPKEVIKAIKNFQIKKITPYHSEFA